MIGHVIQIGAWILASLAVMALLWPWIRDLFSKSIIPWVRERLGDTTADLLADLITFLDDKAFVPVRKRVRDGLKWLDRNILKMETTYRRTSSTTVMGATETLLMLPNGKVARRVEEEEMSWEDVPQEIRSEFTRQNSERGVFDTRKVVKKKLEERASEAGLSDELSYEQ